MSNMQKVTSGASELRRIAEARLGEKYKLSSGEENRAWSEVDQRRMQHELEVHQIELEMQNEAILQAQMVTEQRLSLALSASRQGLFDLNLQTGDITVTPDYALMLGYDPDGFRETHAAWCERLHPDDREHVLTAYQEYITGKLSEYHIEFRQRTRSGEWLWFQTVGRLVECDSSRRPLRMLGTFTDVSKLKCTEQLIRLQTASLEAVANGVVITSVDGSIVWANRAFYQLSGYCQEECLGHNLRDLVNSRGQSPEFYENLWKTILSGGVWRGELKNRRKCGSCYDEEMTITPLLDAKNTVTHFIAVKQDITERKKAEGTIRELGCAVEQAVDGIAIHDIAGEITYANAAWTRMHGCAPNTATGKRIDLFRTSFPSEWDGGDEIQSQDLSVNFSGEVVRHRADGAAFPVYLSKSELRDSHGYPLGGVEIAHDISEARAAERALSETEARLSQVVLAGSIGLWDWDIPRDIFECSAEYCRQLGCTPADLKGSADGWFSRLHPDDDAHNAWIRTGLIDYPKSSFDHEIRMRHQDGTYRWFLVSATIKRDRAGKAIFVSGANVDITERKRLEEECLQAQKLESIGRLAGGIAHDFNNLLSVISGFTEMVLMKVTPESPLSDDLAQVIRAAERAANLTRQLLAFSRRQVLRPEVINLNSVIVETEKMIGRLVGDGVDLSLQLQEDLWLVFLDRAQFEQVLVNLVVNARDAMPRGGHLVIQSSNLALGKDTDALPSELKAGSYVVIMISDDGVGMDDQDRKRVFEPFFTTKERGHGTGLGLATVFGIVQQSGGVVTVDSERYLGTTFRIYLPRTDKSAVSAAGLTAAAPSPGLETILLVEDEEAVRELTRRILSNLGYRVLEAASGEEALALFESCGEQVHLLLTDVMMPGICGTTLARKLVDKHPELRVLFMSGYTADVIAQHHGFEGSFQLVNKPFRAAQLAKAIREVLDLAPL